jgi:hypothetical protein
MATVVIFVRKKQSQQEEEGAWRRDLGKEWRKLGFWGSVWRGKWKSRCVEASTRWVKAGARLLRDSLKETTNRSSYLVS